MAGGLSLHDGDARVCGAEVDADDVPSVGADGRGHGALLCRWNDEEALVVGPVVQDLWAASLGQLL